MNNSESRQEVKEILEKNSGNKLRISFKGGDTFVLDIDHEIDFETYNESGKWYCHIVDAISGNHPKFHSLFKVGNGLDIYESDVLSIHDEKNQLLF